MDDLVPFESPKLLINGVRQRIPGFDQDCRDFLASCPKEIVYRKDPATREEFASIRFGSRMPGRLRVEATHCVTDLRHSLDQAVCDAAIELGRKDTKGVYFPFGRTAADLDREVVARCKGVDASLVAHIRGLNAHQGGDDELYAFGSLAGPIKHQRILQITTDLNSMGMGGPNFRMRGPAETYVRWSDLRNEMEFARTGPGGHINADTEFGLYVGLGTGAPLNGVATAVFARMVDKFERIVVDIEAETIRILDSRGA